MDPGAPLQPLLDQLRLRDEAAAREVFRLFFARVVRLASTRVAAALRRRVDPEDVAQSAMLSLLSWCGWNGRQAAEPRSWEDLWGVLAHITLCKCRKRWRDNHRQGRDLDREVPLLDEMARGGGPEEAAVVTDLVERLAAELSDRDKEILRRTLDGEPPEQIARDTATSLRTLFRVKQQVRDRLQRLLDEAEEEPTP